MANAKTPVSSGISAAGAREHFADIVNRVIYSKERTVVRKHGRNVAAIVSMDDLRLLELIEDKMDIEQALEALDHLEDEGTVSWNELQEELGLKRNVQGSRAKKSGKGTKKTLAGKSRTCK